VQFPLEEYMDEDEVKARAELSFDKFVQALRSVHSHRPASGFKGVHERASKFEARNSPFSVRRCPACMASSVRFARARLWSSVQPTSWVHGACATYSYCSYRATVVCCCCSGRKSLMRCSC
jgi:hypothetical protein